MAQQEVLPFASPGQALLAGVSEHGEPHRLLRMITSFRRYFLRASDEQRSALHAAAKQLAVQCQALPKLFETFSSPGLKSNRKGLHSRRMSAKPSNSAKSAKSKKKAKTPTYYTDEANISQFGLRVGEEVTTPLGIQAVVLGVRYDGEKIPHLDATSTADELAPESDSEVGVDQSSTAPTGVAATDGQEPTSQQQTAPQQRLKQPRVWVDVDGKAVPLPPSQMEHVRRETQARYIKREVYNLRKQQLEEEQRRQELQRENERRRQERALERSKRKIAGSGARSVAKGKRSQTAAA